MDAGDAASAGAAALAASGVSAAADVLGGAPGDDTAVGTGGGTGDGVADAEAAVLLVDVASQQVVFASTSAVQLSGGLHLPAGVRQWSAAAGLRDLDGRDLDDSDHPLARVVQGQPVTGTGVSAERASDLGPHRVPLWLVALPLQGAPQLSGHALVVMLPVQDRDRAQGAALAARSGALLRERAVAATDLSFTVADARAPDMPLVWVNPAFTATTGYSFEEAVGANCRYLQGPGTDPAGPAALRAAIAAQRPAAVTLVNYRKDGSAFSNRVALNPVLDARGQLTHYVGIQEDVSEQVRRAAEREAALAEAQAARAEAEAARADAERAQRRLQLLVETTSELASTLDVPRALQRLGDCVLPELADWVIIATAEHTAAPHGAGGASGTSAALGSVLARHREGRGEQMRAYAEHLLATSTPTSVLRQVLDGAPPTFIADYASSTQRQQRAQWVADPRVLDAADGFGARSVMFVPLAGREEVVGAVVFVRGQDSEPYTAADLTVAVDLGRRAGLIVDNARLFQSEHRIATTLQRSLLPQLPSIPGVRAAARYRAGGAGAAVGGDFYELLALPDGSVAVAIGDVVGHDIIAAAAMGHLRGLVRACAYEVADHRSDRSSAQADDRAGPRGEASSGGAAQPGEVLVRTDQLLQGLGITTMATMAYARLCPLGRGRGTADSAARAAGAAGSADTGATEARGAGSAGDDGMSPEGGWLLSYANAGHPPLLVRHRDGTVEALEDAQGLMLGVQPGPRDSATRVLQAGAVLLGCTDGLVERRGEHLEQGQRRLAEAFAAGPADPDALCEHLLAACVDPGGEDDVALLVIAL